MMTLETSTPKMLASLVVAAADAWRSKL